MRIPASVFTNPKDETFSPQSKKDLFEYNFEYEEEKSLYEPEMKPIVAHRRNVYANANANKSAGKQDN